MRTGKPKLRCTFINIAMNQFRSARYLSICILATTGSAIVFTGRDAAPAATFSWQAATGDWSAATNWSGNLAPSGSDYNFVVDGGTATVTTNNAICGTLALGGGSSGAVQLTAGKLSVADEFVGNSGNAAFVQTGGTNNLSGLIYLGYGVGSVGTYSLSAAGILNSNVISNGLDGECVGYAGTGSFTQTGGRNLTSDLNMAYSPGSSASYTLNSGLLSVSYATFNLGGSGTGVFTQVGGTNSKSRATMTLGLNVGSSGTYNLSSGSLLAYNEYVGSAGTATSTKAAERTTFRIFMFRGSSYTISAGSLSTNSDFLSGTSRNWAEPTPPSRLPQGGLTL